MMVRDVRGEAMKTLMKIGALAKEAGVTVDTVRFYERRGLMPTPARRASGYRVYEPEAADRIRLIKRLQSFGLPLDEILGLLAMVDDGTATCPNQRSRFEAVVARIDQQVKELKATRTKILSALEQCDQGHCSFVWRS